MDILDDIDIDERKAYLGLRAIQACTSLDEAKRIASIALEGGEGGEIPETDEQ